MSLTETAHTAESRAALLQNIIEQVEADVLPPNGRATLPEVLDLAQNGDVIVTDAEYANQGLLGPRPTLLMWKEVTQIGAVKYHKGKKVDIFSEYVVPRVMAEALTPEQWVEFTRITNIEKATVMDSGNTFEAVWERFNAFCGDLPRVVIAGDREVYKWNWALLGQSRFAEINAIEWIILKPLLPVELQRHLSGELYQVVGAKPEDVCEGMTTHNGLFDASSMALFLSLYQIPQ